jgi:mono/diheme cytochrome c family protein
MKLFPISSVAMRALAAGVTLPLVLLPTAAQAESEPQWRSGQYLYDNVCGHCHAPEVNVGPSLGGRGLPEAYIKAIVRNGFNAMPAFPASYVDDESIAKVTEYIATLPLVEQP